MFLELQKESNFYFNRRLAWFASWFDIEACANEDSWQFCFFPMNQMRENL